MHQRRLSAIQPRLTTCLAVAAALLAAGPVLAQDGYVLDSFGGVHAINGAPVISPAASYFGFDIARALEILPGGDGYWVLDGFGVVHAGGTASPPSPQPPFFGFDAGMDIELVPPSSSPLIVPSNGTFQNSDGNQTRFARLYGSSTSGTEIGAGVLFPVGCTAGGLRVGTDRPLVGAETAAVTLLVNEVATSVACTVTGGNSSCTSASTHAISAGDRLAYRVDFANMDTTSNGNVFAFKGFTCS